MSGSSAQAADLGGDCCADLEERVAELEATTARKGNRRVSLTISGQVTTNLMYWNDGGSVRRQSSAGGTATSAGLTNGSDLYVVDNTMSAGGSQFGFAGSAAINPNLTAGFQLVVGLDRGSRQHHTTQTDDDGTSASITGLGTTDTSVLVTLANWYLDHKQLGRVTVGRANSATAGLTGIDLGGAGVVANASTWGYWNGEMHLVSGGTLHQARWGDIMGGGRIWGSGLSRGNLISYTSPNVAGFQVAAAWGENDMWDVALRYAGEFSGFRVAAGIGYTDNVGGFGDANDDSDVPSNALRSPTAWKGSASVLHVASGLYLSGAYMVQDNDVGTAVTNSGVYSGAGDTTMWYVQGGIAKNWTGLGNTVLYGEYARANDGVFACGVGAAAGYVGGGCRNDTDYGGNDADVITGSEASMWGLGIVQNIDAAAMELYLSYRHYEASLTSPAPNNLVGTERFNDLDIVVGGARIRF